MKSFPIPMYDRVLVRKNEIETKSEGGIIIPDTSAQQRQMMNKQGTILEIGEGYRQPDGSVIPLHVRKGMKVYFTAHAGVDIKVGDETLLLMREDEILGIQP